MTKAAIAEKITDRIRSSEDPIELVDAQDCATAKYWLGDVCKPHLQWKRIHSCWETCRHLWSIDRCPQCRV